MFFQTLKERFKEFARDTENIGHERVASANEICDELIASEHADAATIAEWKDKVNDAWADLLELIDTRTELLQTSWELHKYFYDCKDTLERITVSLKFTFSFSSPFFPLISISHLLHNFHDRF